MGPRGTVKATKTTKAVQPATGATLENLPELLRALLAADNDVRGKAEATLKVLGKDPLIVPALLHHLRSDGDGQVRQLAAVVLKRRILGQWSKLPRATHDTIKDMLLDGIVKEPLGLVRRSIADVVSKVAKATVPMGHWNQLPEFLAQCTQSPEEAHRDVAFVIFASLTETIVAVMTQHFATLGGLFQNGLSDASLKVRVAALKAVLALVSNMTGEATEISIVKGLVPHILATARNAVAAGEEENAGLAYEVLDELIESQPAALAGHIPDVVHFCVEMAQAPSLSTVTRRRALDVVSFLARHRPKALLRAKLVQPLLRVLCPLCGEPKEAELAGEDDVDADAEEEMQVQTVAARLVDLLALKVPAKHVLPEVLAFAGPAILSPDPRRRHAAVAVLGIVSEGCADGLQPRAPEIVPLVVQALRDSSKEVRGAAAFTLGQFADYLQCAVDFPEMHREVLPALFAVLPGEPDKSVQERMMYAMDSWLEQLEEEVGPYIRPLLDIVYLALDGEGARPAVREMLLSATASAAAAAGHAMHPHLADLLPRLERCLTAADDQGLRPRARALEVLGMLVSARGGRQAMAPHVPFAMAAAASGFDLDYSELREYGHGMFAEVAEAMGEEFAQYLPACAAKAMASLDLDDGVVYDSDEEENARGGGGGGGGSDSEEDLDSDEEGGGGGRGRENSNYSVFSGVVEEKAAACKAVASYAHHCPVAFRGYIDQFVDKMGNMADYMHEMVRMQAHAALARLAQCALLGAPPPTGNLSAMPAVDAALNAAQRAMLEDDDRDAVAAAMEAAAEVVKSVGAAAGGGIAHLHSAGHITGLADHCLAVLEGRAMCQEGEDEEGGGGAGGEDEEEDEEAELGQIVLEGCAELLPALATIAGASFAPAFKPHFAALLRRTGANRPEGQRSVAYATLVEVVRAIGSAATPVVPLALPGCLRELRAAETAGLRRNCTYCAGVMVEVGGAAAAPFHGALAQALAHLLSSKEPDRGVRDNAASSAARLLSVDGCAAVRDPAVGPPLVSLFLAALPLVEDFEEAASAYGGVCALLRSGDPGVSAHVPRMLQVIGQVAAEEAGKEAEEPITAQGGEADRVPAEVLAAMGRTVADLLAQFPAQISPVLAALPAEHQTAVRALMPPA